MKDFKPQHFIRRMEGDVAVIIFNRPERKNTVTFDSYVELSKTLHRTSDVQKIIIALAVLSEISGTVA